MRNDIYNLWGTIRATAFIFLIAAFVVFCITDNGAKEEEPTAALMPEERPMCILRVSAAEPVERTNPDTEPVEPSEPSEPIASEPPQSEPIQSKRYPLTDKERATVEAVVAAEARGEGFDGQCLVAQCILNTAEETGQRPDEVVLAKGQYASPKYDLGYMVSEAVAAVFDDGYQVTAEPIRYFYAPKYCTSSWHENRLVFVLEYGGHRFFKEK